MDLISTTTTRLAAALSLIALAFISVSDFLLTASGTATRW